MFKYELSTSVSRMAIFGCYLVIVSRCLVYLYLVVSLVAVSIFSVIEQMPCLYVFGS